MRYPKKTLSFVCVGVLCATVVCNLSVRQSGSEKQLLSVTAEATQSNACLSPEQIVAKLNELSAATGPELEQIKELFLKESQRSGACRKSLIESIVKTMDRPKSAFEDGGEQFNLWRSGAEVLADLKATEALDFLVAHLDFSSGMFSTTMSHMPVLKAVIRIGDSAIPKLGEVLRQNPNPSMRMYSVYGISLIGGPAAVRTLKEASEAQSDRCVTGFLRASVEALDNEKQRVIDTTKWFAAFLCQS